MRRTITTLALALILSTGLPTFDARADLIVDPAPNEAGCCGFGIRGYFFEASEDFVLDTVWLNTVSGLSTSYQLEILRLNSPPPVFPANFTDYTTLASFVGASGILDVDFSFSAGELVGLLAWDNNLGLTPYSTEFAQDLFGSSITLNRLLRQNLVVGDPISTEAGPIGAIGFSYTAVPEPGTLALLGFGLLGMGLARRRKKA